MFSRMTKFCPGYGCFVNRMNNQCTRVYPKVSGLSHNWDALRKV